VVAAVQVQGLSAAGQLLEEGPAVDAGDGWWHYTTQQAQPIGAASSSRSR